MTIREEFKELENQYKFKIKCNWDDLNKDREFIINQAKIFGLTYREKYLVYIIQEEHSIKIFEYDICRLEDCGKFEGDVYLKNISYQIRRKKNAF